MGVHALGPLFTLTHLILASVLACCLFFHLPLLPHLLQLDKASRGGVAGSKSSSVGGIGSMLPLLIVAVLAFLVGQYVSGGLPALQQLVSGAGRDD
jgi:hypothetical protein